MNAMVHKHLPWWLNTAGDVRHTMLWCVLCPVVVYGSMLCVTCAAGVACAHWRQYSNDDDNDNDTQWLMTEFDFDHPWVFSPLFVMVDFCVPGSVCGCVGVGLARSMPVSFAHMVVLLYIMIISILSLPIPTYPFSLVHICCVLFVLCCTPCVVFASPPALSFMCPLVICSVVFHADGFC